jgi:hypothetical protein
MAFKVPRTYDYVTTLRRKEANVIHNQQNANVCDIGKGEAPHKKYKRLKFGGCQACNRSSE